jgi:hypothetical protein
MGKPKETMADLNDINTVQDLIRENERPNPTKDLLKSIYRLDPSEGLIIVTDILENLIGYHQSVVEGYKKEGETTNATVWAYDAAIIESSLALLKNIEL